MEEVPSYWNHTVQALEIALQRLEEVAEIMEEVPSYWNHTVQALEIALQRLEEDEAHYHERARKPLAGTGSGDLYMALGIRHAVSVIRAATKEV